MTAAGLAQGTVEVETDAAFAHTGYSYDGDSVGSRTDVALSVGVGYCLTDMLEIKGRFMFAHTSLDPECCGSVSASSFGGAGLVALNFPTAGPVVPFVQGGAGVLAYSGDGYEDSDATVVLPTAGVGVRFVVGETASVNCGVFYEHHLNAAGEEDVSANIFGVSVGLSLLL